MKYRYRMAELERDLVDEENGEVLATEPLSPDYPINAARVAAAMKKQIPVFKTPHNHDTDAVSLATATLFPEKGRTDQTMKDETDVNKIVEKYIRTGGQYQIPGAATAPSFLDIPDDFDMVEALNQVRAAEDAFAALPAKLRREFDNDPAQMLEWVREMQEKGDLAELKRLGLVADAPKAPETAPGGAPAPEPSKGPDTGPKT